MVAQSPGVGRRDVPAALRRSRQGVSVARTARAGRNRLRLIPDPIYPPASAGAFFAFWGLTHRARSCNTHGMARRNEGQIVVRLPNAMLDEIAHRAAEEDRSKSQIVRMAIASYLSEAA